VIRRSYSIPFQAKQSGPKAHFFRLLRLPRFKAKNSRFQERDENERSETKQMNAKMRNKKEKNLDE
jgi:hypothetical protein